MSKTEQTTLDTGRVKQVPRDYEGQLGNGEDIPTVIESDGDEERCPYCGDWYSSIGNHWSHTSVNCSHPPVSRYKMGWLKGMMLGDGSLTGTKKNEKLAYTIQIKPL